MNSVYQINKGVDKSIVFRGLKGQWIAWLCAGLLLLLFLFALCYIAGVPLKFCVLCAVAAGSVLFYVIYRYNNKYGEHGLMKKLAHKVTPKEISCDKLFVK